MLDLAHFVNWIQEYRYFVPPIQTMMAQFPVALYTAWEERNVAASGQSLKKVFVTVEHEEGAIFFQSKLCFAVFSIIYEYAPASYLVDKPVPFTSSNSSFAQYSMLKIKIYQSLKINLETQIVTTRASALLLHNACINPIFSPLASNPLVVQKSCSQSFSLLQFSREHYRRRCA